MCPFLCISVHICLYQVYISVYQTYTLISVHIRAYLYLSKHLCQYLCLFISSISVYICQYLSISVHMSISANMFQIVHGDSAWRKCMEIVAPTFAGTRGSHGLPTCRMWESSDCQCGPGTTYTTAPSPDRPPTAGPQAQA